MATGILSLAARELGLTVLSDLLLGITALAFLALAGNDLIRLAAAPRLLLGELRSGAIFDYLTFAAAAAVLGNGLLLAGASPDVAWTLLLVAGLSWLTIAGTVAIELVALRVLHPRSQVEGGWLLAVVAPQSLSILALALANRAAAPRALGSAALGLWVLGSALYAPIAVERLARLSPAHGNGVEMRPDDWILMGALAISALAGVHLAEAPGRGGLGAGAHPFLLAVAAAELALALVSILPLALAEAHRRRGTRNARPLTSRRWSTVFPLGMLSTSCGAFAAPAQLGALTVLAWILFAAALAAWLALATRLAGRAVELHHGSSAARCALFTQRERPPHGPR